MPDASADAPRHSLVRVRPAALRGALATRGPADLLDRWVDAGWPAVLRRRCAADPAAAVPLGLPLPPACGKARLAIAVPPDAVLEVRPPVALMDLASGAPAAWQATIARLLRLGDALGLVPRVYGSFAFAHLTGLAYLGPNSDLDLVWPLPADSAPLLAGLTAIEAQAPGALDGEIVRPSDGAAANWRELRDGVDRLLVKTRDAIALLARDDFLALADA